MAMASEDGLNWPLCVPLAKLGFAPRKRLTQSCGLSRCKSDSCRQRLLPAIAMALAGTAKSLERTIGGLPVFMHAPWRSFAGTEGTLYLDSDTHLLCVCNATGYVQVADGTTGCS